MIVEQQRLEQKTSASLWSHLNSQLSLYLECSCIKSAFVFLFGGACLPQALAFLVMPPPPISNSPQYCSLSLFFFFFSVGTEINVLKWNETLKTHLWYLDVVVEYVCWGPTSLQVRASSTILPASSIPNPNFSLVWKPAPLMCQPDSSTLGMWDPWTTMCCRSRQVRFGLQKKDKR